MIPPGSRYEQADKEFVDTHLYDSFNRPLVERDTGVYRYVFESREATYLLTTLPLPPPPPQQYYVKDGETFQYIAYKFLKDPTRWWQIAEANPQVWYPLDAGMGDFIRVPT